MKNIFVVLVLFLSACGKSTGSVFNATSTATSMESSPFTDAKTSLKSFQSNKNEGDKIMDKNWKFADKEMNLNMFDNVRILSSPETDELGLSGKAGQIYGFTTPSSTSVDVIGHVANDLAYNVFVEEINEQFWFAPELLELVDYAEGTEIVLGDNLRAVRRADGSWEQSEIIPKKKWWQFWR